MVLSNAIGLPLHTKPGSIMGDYTIKYRIYILRYS